MDQQDHVRAHESSIRHRAEVSKSELCGCFYCLKIFAPSDIEDWIDEPIDGGQSALCPRCGIDSVIGSASGFPISEAFLARMNAYWFRRT